MAISRGAAFGVFEDLLREGLGPVMTGFRSQDDRNEFWPKGREGFFVYAHFSSTERLGVITARLSEMDAIAARHGLVAWFSGREDEYDEDRYDGTHHEFRVTFENASPRREAPE